MWEVVCVQTGAVVQGPYLEESLAKYFASNLTAMNRTAGTGKEYKAVQQEKVEA